MNYLGIDIGSSGCKAVVYNSNGEELAWARRDYNSILIEGGGAELNSGEVISKCFEVIGECAAKVQTGSIQGIGISSQGEAVTAVDENGEILCNGMISSDTRGDPFLEPWTRSFGEERLYQITGHTAHPMFTLFKLLWLKEKRSEVWRRTRKFLCFEDLLQFRLGLDPAISYPLAGRTMLFDVRKHQWDASILSSIGIDPENLARPLPSGSVVGPVNSNIAKKLGLAETTYVVTGGHDQACGALGAGITASGMAVYATGTVECITPTFSEALFSPVLRQNNLCTYDHTVKGMYITVAFSLTGGNLLQWFRDEFGHQEVMKAREDDSDAYKWLMDTAGEEPSDLLVLPYFTPSGTPYFDTKTRGAILGLRLSTTRGEILRAMLEGIAYEMRLNMEILADAGNEIKEFRAIGGGTKSDIWTQLKADVTGKKITVLNITEAGCAGAAMLACAAKDVRSVAELASQWVHPVAVFSPRAKHAAWYDIQFRRYRKLYTAIKDFEDQTRIH